MLEYLRDWLTFLLSFGWANIIVSLLLFVAFSIASLLIVTAILVRIPSTYFCDSHPRDLWTNKHPVIRWLGVILKNITGVFLAILGIVLTMPGIPGPGLLTVAIGVLLLDFPGKRRVERRLISHPKIFSAINRLRLKHGKQPLVLDDRPCERAPAAAERMKQDS